MDWQIRIALILVGLGVIAYIYFDYARRKKNEKHSQRLIEQMRTSAEQIDSQGFDFTGVGNVRKRNAHGQIEEVSTRLDGSDINEALNPIISHPGQAGELESAAKSAPTEQMSLDSWQDNDEKHSIEQPEQVISLILRADSDKPFKGSEFMPLFLSQGLRHGEMDIFHRFETTNGKKGPILYSVANAISPGTFELSGIELFSTPALAFFMTLPTQGVDPVLAFDAMVNTMRLLKSELGGQLLDETKSVYTDQTHQHKLDVIRTYRIKSAVRSQK